MLVNYTEAGTGDIEAEVRCSGESVPCELVDDEESDDCIKRLEFSPLVSGMHFVHVKFNKQPIAGTMLCV